MTIRRFVVFGNERRAGLWLDQGIADVETLITRWRRGTDVSADPNPAWQPDGTLLNLIQGGSEALACIERAIATSDSDKLELEDVQSTVLHPPVIPTARIACAGGNFADHMAAMAARVSGETPPPTLDEARKKIRDAGIWGFWKLSAPVGDGALVHYPRRAERLDYEGELAVVLGLGGNDMAAESAAAAIWGVTLLNDLSIRAPREPEAIYKFALGKNFDGSCAVGPCIVVGADIPSLRIRTFVNGIARQDFAPADMVFSYVEYMMWLSRDFSLSAGDIVSGGTGAGTAADSSPIGERDRFPPDLFLKPGDVVDVECEHIGRLRTTIINGEVQAA